VTQDVTALQRALLEAVLSGTPLPGSGTPVELPDKAWLGDEAPVRVLRDGIAQPDALAELPVRLVSAEELAAAAREGSDIPYLRFGPVDRGGGRVRLTLELALAPAGAGRGHAGLSGVQAEFAPEEPEPRAISDPAYFAS
jgi:hypothetical protein